MWTFVESEYVNQPKAKVSLVSNLNSKQTATKASIIDKLDSKIPQSGKPNFNPLIKTVVISVKTHIST